jgi:DmsE family decaheme c-type cytochrome
MRRRAIIGPLLLLAGLAPVFWMSYVAAAQAPPSPVPLASAPEPAKSAPDAVSPAAMEECRTCHEQQMAGMKGTYHLGLDRSCASCHGDVHAHLKSVTETGDPGPVVSFKKMKAREVNAACLTCHDKGRQANWHGGMHDRRGVSCTSCHSVHAFLSPRAQLKTVREPESCYSCHTQMRAKSMRASHHPVIEGVMGCASCHDPHDGTRPKMLTAESVNEKCLQCHTEKRGPFLWEHAPARESCVLCHDPHGSNHDNLLVAKQPYLCQRCHLNTRHPGTLYDQRNTVGGASISNRAIEHSCRNCHQNVHGGNAPSGPYLGR